MRYIDMRLRQIAAEQGVSVLELRHCGAKQHFWMRRGQVIRSLCGMQLAWLATEPELEGVKCKRCKAREGE